MAIRKKTVAGKISDRAEKGAYRDQLAEFLIEKVAHDLHRGVVSPDIAAYVAKAKGETSGGVMQLLSLYDPEGVSEAIREELERLESDELAGEADAA